MTRRFEQYSAYTHMPTTTTAGTVTDNRTTELLPCPFCGGEPTAIETHPGRGELYCGNCDVVMGGDNAMTPEELTAAWNTRADYHGYEQAAIEAWESIKAWNTRAELGSGTCRIIASSTDGLCSDNPRQWFKLSCGHSFMLYGLDVPVACAVCGKRVSA